MPRYALRLCGVLVLCGLASFNAGAAVTSGEASRELEAKVSLENSLEKRLQGVLREMLGTDDLIVIVNVVLRSEAEAKQEADVLPGVPVQAADPLTASGLAMPMVSRLSATVMVDQNTPPKDVELTKTVAAGILGISAARGDVLNVEMIKFHKSHLLSDSQRYVSLASSILWLIFAVVAGLFLQKKFLGPLITSLRDLSTAALMRKSAEERAPAAEREASATEAAEKSTATSPAPAPETIRPVPFAFISGRDVPKLIHILRTSSVEDASTIIQYLPADIAGKLLASLEVETRRQVVNALSRVSELSEYRVRPVEDSLRKRIDFLIGGEDKLVELFGALPSSMQADLLFALRDNDPATAENVSKRLFFLEDLSVFEPAEIKLLSRRVPAKILAVILKSSAELQASVLPKLAAGTREWLIQEINLSPEPAPEALEAARQTVIASVSQLLREGRIVLRKKAPVAAPPPAVLPPAVLPPEALPADELPSAALPPDEPPSANSPSEAPPPSDDGVAQEV